MKKSSPSDTPAKAELKRGSINPQPLEAAQIDDALLKLKVAGAVYGMSPSMIYRRAASDPTFPKLIKLGTRCTRIRAGDLKAWLAAQQGR